jgi:tetratricopeptide (TPR) repeat protein
MKALEIYQKSLPPNHPDLANSFNNIAMVYQKTKDYAKAVSFCEKGLEIRQKTLLPNHPDLAISFSNLWQLHQTMGDNVKAYLIYQQSIENHEKTNSDGIQLYNAIEQVYGNKEESTNTSSFVKPVIKNIQVPKQFRIKNFRMKLELRAKKK